MASPSIESALATNNSASSSSFVVNFPATVSAGSTVLCWIGSNGATFTFPGGWTKLAGTDYTGTSGDRANVAWLKAAGTEGGTTFTVTLSVGVKAAACVWSITGASDPTVTPPETGTVATGSGTANPDPPSCTPSGGSNDYLFFALAHGEGAVTVSSYPTNYSLNQISEGTSGGSAGSNVRTAGAGRALTGTTDNPGTYTYSGTIPWIGQTVAVYPGAAAAPDPGVIRARPLLPTLHRFSPLMTPIWPFPVPKVDVVTSATFPQAMDADAVLVTASMQRQVNKGMTGTAVAVTGTIQKQVNKLLSATAVAVTASIRKQVNKTLTATSVVVTASMLAIKVILKTMTATTVVVTASMVKQANKALTGTAVVVTAAMQKQVNKALTGTAVVVTASMTAIKVILKTMTATTVAVTGSMVRQVNKAMTATSLVVTASRQIQVNKKLTATTVAATAALTAIKVILKTMTATAVVVTASMTRRALTNLSATVAVTGSMVKMVTHRLTATVTATASMVAQFVSGTVVVVVAGAVALADTILNAVGVGHSETGATAAQDAPGTDATVTATTGNDAAQDAGTGADVTIVEPPH